MVKEITLTQGKVTVVDDEDYGWLSKWKWCAVNGHNGFHAESRVGGKHVYIHRLIMDAQPGQQVDHRDHDGLNNTRCNLRLCTNAENARNQRKRPGCSSPLKGVTRTGRRQNPWMAQITLNRANIYLGCYSTQEAAAKAYDVAAVKYHGEFALLNEYLETC